MKKFAIVLCLLALAGVPVYRTMTASEYGVSKEHPLGQFRAIESWLLQRPFEKSEGGTLDTESFPDAPPEVREAQVLHYVDVPKSKDDNVNYQVTVIVDALGQVRAFGTGFFSGSDRVSVPLSRCEGIAQKMWKEVTGAPPTFTEQICGKGRFATMQLVATYSGGGVSGSWAKRYMSTGDPRSIFDQVMLYTDH